MLRSYQYTESSYLKYTMQNKLYREKETAIARNYVASHRLRRDLHDVCPICGEKAGRHFYTKWSVDYLRCSACKSIFAVCDEEIVRGYQEHHELQEFRIDSGYQRQISENREKLWKSFLEWVEVRAYRFIGRNRGLNILDVGNRFRGYSEMIAQSPLCGVYDLRRSILGEDTWKVSAGMADIVFYLDRMQQDMNPKEVLHGMREYLKKDGLLFLSTRAGSGFDILTLKEHNRKIYPYEHILLPSRRGLVGLLEKCGYEVVEITTPGVMDVQYVAESMETLDDREEFVRYMLEETGDNLLQEFQRFLQKSGLSSFVCIIARRKRRMEQQDEAV